MTIVVNESAYPERTPVTSSGGGLQNIQSQPRYLWPLRREEHETLEFLVSSEEPNFIFLYNTGVLKTCSTPDFHGTKRNIYIHLVNQYFVKTITLCWYTWYFTGWKIIQNSLTLVKKNSLGQYWTWFNQGNSVDCFFFSSLLCLDIWNIRKRLAVCEQSKTGNHT